MVKQHIGTKILLNRVIQSFKFYKYNSGDKELPGWWVGLTGKQEKSFTSWSDDRFIGVFVRAIIAGIVGSSYDVSDPVSASNIVRKRKLQSILVACCGISYYIQCEEWVVHPFCILLWPVIISLELQ